MATVLLGFLLIMIFFIRVLSTTINNKNAYFSWFSFLQSITFRLALNIQKQFPHGKTCS